MSGREHLDELESLLGDWEAGTLDEAGVSRVREILRSDAEARTLYVQHQLMSTALTQEGSAGLTLHSTSEPIVASKPTVASEQANASATSDASKTAEGNATSARQNTSSTGDGLRMNYWLAAAAGLLICLLSGRLLYLEFSEDMDLSSGSARQDGSDQGDDTKEATSQGVAIVTRLVDIRWDEDQAPLEVGDALTPGRLAVKAGYVQVEFFCGATVILEGPAELDLKSSTLARVYSGRLRAQVPPAARGFSLEVDDMKVVDLGTEFGLSVSSEGADVQVFDGEVEVHRGNDSKQNLTTGQAVRRNAAGLFEASKVTPGEFLDIGAMESRDRGQHTARQQRWQAWSMEWRRDPRLIAYYAFDQKSGWQRRLSSSNEPADHELDGAIVGARRVQGRWPSKGGLEFKRPGDRVRVQIPGEYSSLTLACWAKIDSLDRMFNSLFLTDSYNQGEPHWQILDTGQMYFSVRPSERGQEGPRDKKILSPRFWKPSMSGKWLHLATTYNVESGRVIHYLNGELLHAEMIPESQVVKTTRIGTASIGNWSLPTLPDAEFAIRNLNGTIDEFAMLAAALTADEIKEMYEHGKP